MLIILSDIYFRKPLAVTFAYDVPCLITQFRIGLHVFYPSRRSFIRTIHRAVHILPSMKCPCACVGSTGGESMERTWALLVAPKQTKMCLQRVLYKARL